MTTRSVENLLHLGAGYRSNYFFVPSVTRTGEWLIYNAEKRARPQGGLENKFFPTMSGFLQGTARADEGNRLRGRNESDHAKPVIQRIPQLGEEQSQLQNSAPSFAPKAIRRSSMETPTAYTAFPLPKPASRFRVLRQTARIVGFGYASFLLGQVDSINMSNPDTAAMGKKQLGIYAQDTWKVTSRFTLDYGLRYDYSTYLRAQYGRAPEFSPTTLHPKLRNSGAAIYDGEGPGRCNCDIAKTIRGHSGHGWALHTRSRLRPCSVPASACVQRYREQQQRGIRTRGLICIHAGIELRHSCDDTG
jgi:hypothetical protein